MTPKPPFPEPPVTRLHCFECHKSVSSEVPADIVVRATIICPDCLELADPVALERALRSITEARAHQQRLMRLSGDH